MRITKSQQVVRPRIHHLLQAAKRKILQQTPDEYSRQHGYEKIDLLRITHA